MEKPIKLIFIIMLLGVGFCMLVINKKSNDQIVTLENCPYRTSIYVYTNDASEVHVKSRVFYDPTVVSLDEARYGSNIANHYARIVIYKYSIDDLLKGHVCDIEDEVNDSLHQYNENLRWYATLHFRKESTPTKDENSDFNNKRSSNAHMDDVVEYTTTSSVAPFIILSLTH